MPAFLQSPKRTLPNNNIKPQSSIRLSDGLTRFSMLNFRHRVYVYRKTPPGFDPRNSLSPGRMLPKQIESN